MRKISRKAKMIAASAALVLGLAGTTTACFEDDGGSGKKGTAKDTETLSAVLQAAQTAEPYPLAQMKSGGFLERSLLTENLLRQNDKHRLAYVVLLNMQGQPIAQYPIKGMVFSLNSQLTRTDQTERHGQYGDGSTVVTAVGDNGTFGSEPDGIGFFTTSGVEIKWNGLYVESDAPLDLKTKPLITYNVNQSPSVDHGGVR